MMDCQIRESDRISELPVFLLHHILSCLPRKDAVRTSVLSKHWDSVWHSFPILKFEVDEYIKDDDDTPGFAEKLQKFLNLVDKSLKNFTQNKLRMEVCDLYIYLIDKKFIPRIDTWIPLALHNGASHISFSFTAKLSGFRTFIYPLPETTFVVKSICGSSRFYQLHTLELSMVYLSENMVRDIIRNCPNISDLSLWYFHGLKTLEISKLEKLKKLCIGVDGREVKCLSIDVPLLENLYFLSYGPELPCVISPISRRALKSLTLSMCNITDYLLSSYISTSPLLEYLHVYGCNMLCRPRISAQRLKTLELHDCGELEVVQIHAPNLSKFEFNTYMNMPILFSENVIRCSMKINYQISYTTVLYNSFWFLKLREFLGVSAQGVIFSLLVIKKEISFDPEALRDVAIPPLVNVDLLEIRSRRSLSEFDCAALIDGLLWSCHPKEISIHSYSLFERHCIKALCEKLLGMEQPLSCCKLSHVKCWRHSFESAKIENSGGIEDDLSFHPNLLDSLSSLAEGQEVRFRLNWEL